MANREIAAPNDLLARCRELLDTPEDEYPVYSAQAEINRLWRTMARFGWFQIPDWPELPYSTFGSLPFSGRTDAETENEAERLRGLFDNAVRTVAAECEKRIGSGPGQSGANLRDRGESSNAGAVAAGRQSPGNPLKVDVDQGTMTFDGLSRLRRAVSDLLETIKRYERIAKPASYAASKDAISYLGVVRKASEALDAELARLGLRRDSVTGWPADGWWMPIAKRLFESNAKTAGKCKAQPVSESGGHMLYYDSTMPAFGEYSQLLRDALWRLDEAVAKEQDTEPEVKTMAPKQDGGIFIVRGHDDALREGTARLVHKATGTDPTILSEKPGKGQTLIEKFEEHGGRGEFRHCLAHWR